MAKLLAPLLGLDQLLVESLQLAPPVPLRPDVQQAGLLVACEFGDDQRMGVRWG